MPRPLTNKHVKPLYSRAKITRHACSATAVAAIDRCVLPARRSAANPPAAAAAVDRRDRQTDGRTGTRPLYDAITTYYADPRSMWEANRHPIQGSMGQPAQQEAR